MPLPRDAASDSPSAWTTPLAYGVHGFIVSVVDQAPAQPWKHEHGYKHYQLKCAPSLARFSDRVFAKSHP